RVHVKPYREEEAARIRVFVLKHVHEQPTGLAMFVVDNIYVQPTYAYQEIRRMVREGLLRSEGKTANRRYHITERGAELRDKPPPSRNTFSSQQEADAELLAREPRTMHEAERRAWLMRRIQRNG
ncbi:MAG: hypothetical protein KY410_08060, partial [Proteobacteria bacterium]|nr:hypothetical protein [Pseudomonadota bacterium]